MHIIMTTISKRQRAHFKYTKIPKKSETFIYIRKARHFAKSKTICVNVNHRFMPIKRVANINGYHSPPVRRKYKSRYLLESRH